MSFLSARPIEVVIRKEEQVRSNESLTVNDSGP
jgi:hypothetical protein